MERIKHLLRRVFIRPWWQTLLIAPACFILLIWVLTHETPAVLDHIAYQLSVYGLVISVTTILRVVPAVKQWLSQNRLINSTFGYLLRKDEAFRAWLSLFLSMGWNLLYAIIKLLAGWALKSMWLKLMGVYYLVLALLRLILVRPVGKRPAGEIAHEQVISEWRRYRLCGATLLIMNQVLMMVVILLLTHRGRFNYPGSLIYLMAAYAFWAVTNATIKLVKFHRKDDPLMSAAKAVSLTAAMVSMLSLETALITRFSEGEGGEAFHYIMTSVVGGVVCMLELFIALYMIRRGTRMIRELQKTSE